MGLRIAAGAIVVLLLVLGTVGLLYKSELKKSAQLSQTVRQQEVNLNQMGQELERAQRIRKGAEKIAANHRRQNEKIRKEIRGLRNEVQRLERENKEYQDWANKRVPDAVVDMLGGVRDENGNKD